MKYDLECVQDSRSIGLWSVQYYTHIHNTYPGATTVSYRACLNPFRTAVPYICGDKPLKFQVVCPQNGTAVLKGLTLLLEVDCRDELTTRAMIEVICTFQPNMF